MEIIQNRAMPSFLTAPSFGLLPEETILVDDRIYNLHAAIDSGARPVRMRCEFTTDLTGDLSLVPEFPSVPAFRDWLIGS